MSVGIAPSTVTNEIDIARSIQCDGRSSGAEASWEGSTSQWTALGIATFPAVSPGRRPSVTQKVTAKGDQDAFVAKLSASGAVQWVLSAGGGSTR
jgi:hypothetical protein